MKRVIILLLLLSPAFGTNYYVSKSAGSDSNAGTSKGAAWAHAPGMASYTGGHSVTAGDTYILMGCDHWTASDLPIFYNSVSGSSGSNITIGGEDQTWYNTSNCPSAWNRPVFDNSAHAALANTNCNNDGASHQSQVFLCIATSASVSYYVMDQIEWTGLTCTGSCTGLQSYIWEPGCANCSITNNYFHALNVAQDGSCILVKTYVYPSNTGNLYQFNIFDGSDRSSPGSGGQCDVFYGDYGGGTIDGNVIRFVTNGIVLSSPSGLGPTLTISRNLISNIIATNCSTGCNHDNALEDQGGETLYVYNNVIHDSAGESYFTGGGSFTGYVFNNLWYNILGNPPDFETRNGSWTGHWWNNTIVANVGGGGCFLQTGTGSISVTLENTHCVGNSLGVGGGNFTLNNNTVMSAGTATGQGYTAAQTFAYSPTAGGNGTVGAGKKICGVEATCTGLLASLANDTTYACTYNSTAQTITCPARTVNARKATPDSGAYEFTAASGPQFAYSPAPVAFGNVNDGTGSPLTVTITNPGTGTLTLGTLGSPSDAEYVISSNTCNAADITVGSCTFVVTFTPTSAGSHPATISVPDNVGNPDTISLTGTGVLSGPVVSLTCPLACTTLAFGNQQTNATSTGQVVTLTNIGNATLSITSITFTTGTQFGKSTTCGSTLGAGLSCAVTVSFTPTSTGAKSDSLVFTTNAPSSPDSVSLTGTGVLLTHLPKPVGCSTSSSPTTNPYSWTCTPQATGDATTMFVQCHPSSGVVSGITLAASGWTITQLVAPLSTGSNSWGSLFGAIAPSTAAATFTATFTGGADCATFATMISDEWQGNSQVGGTTTFNAAGGTSGSSSTCNQSAANITPPLDNESVVFVCFGSNVQGATSPWLYGTVDASNNLAGYQILVGGKGTPLTPAFSWGANGVYIVEGVAIAPLIGSGPSVAPAGRLFAENTK